MLALRFLLHTYAYLFHLILAIFLFGIALVGWLSGTGNFELGMIPWASGARLVCFLLVAAPIGILSVLLAYTGRLRSLFAVWTLFALVTAVWGFFFSSYSYNGMEDFQTVLWFVAAVLMAALGGLSQLKPLKS